MQHLNLKYFIKLNFFNESFLLSVLNISKWFKLFKMVKIISWNLRLFYWAMNQFWTHCEVAKKHLMGHCFNRKPRFKRELTMKWQLSSKNLKFVVRDYFSSSRKSVNPNSQNVSLGFLNIIKSVKNPFHLKTNIEILSQISFFITSIIH